MSLSTHAVEQRKLRSIARRYERDGYRVTMPGQGGGLPAFLEGFEPDLIAESEQERVVIEVKRSDAVRGSNELLGIAERVAREPGWRFELVTVSPVEQVSAPTPERMDLIQSRARKVMGIGLTDMAYVYAWTALEEVLRDLALQHGLNAARTPFLQAIRDLVSRGVISREVFETVEQARRIRNQMVHAESEVLPSVADVENLLKLGQLIRGEVAAAVDG